MTIELILLLIFLVFMLSGYRKGLILSLCTLVILVLSCLGASVARNTLTPKITQELQPRLAAAISQELEIQLSQTGSSLSGQPGDAGITVAGEILSREDLRDLLLSLGMDAQYTPQEAAEQVTEPIADSLAQAMASTVLETFGGIVVFCLAFLLIFLVLRTIELGVNTVDRLPVIHTLNHLGGGLVGLVSGAFFLVTAMAILSATGLVNENAFSGPISGLLRSIVREVLNLLSRQNIT